MTQVDVSNQLLISGAWSMRWECGGWGRRGDECRPRQTRLRLPLQSCGEPLKDSGPMALFWVTMGPLTLPLTSLFPHPSPPRMSYTGWVSLSRLRKHYRRHTASLDNHIFSPRAFVYYHREQDHFQCNTVHRLGRSDKTKGIHMENAKGLSHYVQIVCLTIHLAH